MSPTSSRLTMDLMSSAIEIDGCTSDAALQGYLVRVAERLGCSNSVFTCSVALSGYEQAGSTRHTIYVLRGCAQSWCETYAAQGYRNNDVFNIRAMTGQRTILRSDVVGEPSLTSGQRAQLERAAVNGFRQGGAIAAYGAGSWMGLLYLGSSEQTPDVEAAIRHSEPALYYIAGRLLDRSQHLLKSALMSRFGGINDVEQIARFLIQGMTSSDIALMTGRSKGSVDAFIRRACLVLDCEKREQLAHVFARAGMIAPTATGA